MGMIDIIKKAGVDAVGANNPVNVLFGEVLNIDFTQEKVTKNNLTYYITKNINTLTIKVDQKLILQREFFIVPESVTRYEVDLKHTHGSSSNALDKMIIRDGLEKGDKVLLLRVQGGQQYIVLDKVV